MRPPPLSGALVRGALEIHGAAPRRRHGQHFLLDDNLLAAIVRDAGVGPPDTVLEVGPGPGLLTRHLLGAGAAVVAVEIDPLMHAVAGSLIEPGLAQRLEWIEGDVLASSRSLAAPVLDVMGRCTALVANLPYNIAGPLLGLVVTTDPAPGRLVVMVQRELGDRLVAPPGGRQYGSLSVLMALGAHVQILRSVPPGAFWPRPRVDSAVLGIRLRDGRPLGDAGLRLQAFLSAAFHNRRKTLLNSVAEAFDLPTTRVAEVLDLPKNRQNLRAEAFEALEFVDLAHTWAVSALGERHRP